MLTRKVKEQYLQAAKELRSYFNREEYRTFSPEHSFIQWYVDARFGKVSDGDFLYCDGMDDGGIDAIVFQDGGAIAFQMKYEKIPRIGTVARDELAGFEKVAKLLTDETQQDAFSVWLGTVRPSLRNRYRKLRRIPHGKLQFVFVTSKCCELTSGTVEIEDIKKILSLWSLYREGFTPPTDSIKLTLESTWYASSNNGFTTHVGLANVQDFLRLMRDDKNERLFAQNVRTDLGSPINQEIRRTYERKPEEFWLGNNGIYIVCRAVNQSGRSFTLTFPSIINGSQTLHSIAASEKSHDCKILARILEMDVIGNPTLLGEVIRRTNTQNPMKLVNLAAHDPFQLNIARYLDKYCVFYERREKEWVNEKKGVLPDYIPVNIKEMGQWLSLLDLSIGMGRARSRVSDLFQENPYKRIFGEFDSELRSTRFTKLAYAVWAGLFIKNYLRSIPSAKRTLYQIPRLLLIRALTEAIGSNKELQEGVLEALKMHRVGKRKIPTKLSRHLDKAVSKLVSIQKRAQRKDESLDYSNFFKVDKHCLDSYRATFTSRAIRSAAQILLTVLDDLD